MHGTYYRIHPTRRNVVCYHAEDSMKEIRNDAAHTILNILNQTQQTHPTPIALIPAFSASYRIYPSVCPHTIFSQCARQKVADLLLFCIMIEEALCSTESQSLEQMSHFSEKEEDMWIGGTRCRWLHLAAWLEKSAQTPYSEISMFHKEF